MPNQVAAAAIQVHQLVYGSAAKLLAPGASDLGVIASTKDFPQDAVRSLATHRAFPNSNASAGKPDDATRYIAGVHGRYVELTRIQQGVDHTGRIVPFANHLLVERDRLQGSGITVGDVLECVSSASNDPRQISSGWIEPSVSLPARRSSQPVPLQSDVIAAIADAALRYATEKRSVVLVTTSRGTDELLPVIAAVAKLLPASDVGAFVAATHVVESSDRPADAAIIGTYPDTPVHTDAVGRSDTKRPLVVDLKTGKANTPVNLSSPFAKATLDDLRAGRPGDFARRCERFGARQAQHQVIADMVTAEHRLLKQPTLANLEAFRNTVPEKVPGLDAAQVQEWANDVALQAFQQHASMILSDAISQPEADGAARLASAISFSRSVLKKLAVRGCQSHQRQLPEAAFIADALRSLGPEGTEIARRVATDPKVNQPSFLQLFTDSPAPTEPRANPGEEIKRKEKPAPKSLVPVGGIPAINGVQIACEGPLPGPRGPIAATRSGDRFQTTTAPPRWLPWMTWAARLIGCAAILLKLYFVVPPPKAATAPADPNNQAIAATASGEGGNSGERWNRVDLKQVNERFSKVGEVFTRLSHAAAKAPMALFLPTVLFAFICVLTTASFIVTPLLLFFDHDKAAAIPTVAAFVLSVVSFLLAASMR